MRDPKIFLSQRPFDSIAKIISLTLPVNWQIVVEKPDLESEKPLGDKVLNFVEQSTHFIVIWSQQSRISSLVNQEIGVALHKRIPVIALVQRGVTLEAMLEGVEGPIYDPANPLEGIVELVNKLDLKLISEGYASLDRASAFQKLHKAWSIYHHWLEVRL